MRLAVFKRKSVGSYAQSGRSYIVKVGESKELGCVWSTRELARAHKNLILKDPRYEVQPEIWETTFDAGFMTGERKIS